MPRKIRVTYNTTNRLFKGLLRFRNNAISIDIDKTSACVIILPQKMRSDGTRKTTNLKRNAFFCEYLKKLHVYSSTFYRVCIYICLVYFLMGRTLLLIWFKNHSIIHEIIKIQHLCDKYLALIRKTLFMPKMYFNSQHNLLLVWYIYPNVLEFLYPL